MLTSFSVRAEVLEVFYAKVPPGWGAEVVRLLLEEAIASAEIRQAIQETDLQDFGTARSNIQCQREFYAAFRKKIDDDRPAIIVNSVLLGLYCDRPWIRLAIAKRLSDRLLAC